MIRVTPSPSLPISTERQQQIITAINERLAAKPRQGFCFMGRPGTGKTYLMKAIRNGVPERIRASTPESKPIVPPICTLASWQENNVDRRIGRSSNRALDIISASYIEKAAQSNALYSKGLNLAKPYPFESLHFFIDEFDSQPTKSDFSSSYMQTFVNACYENAPRLCPGNDQEFVQLVIAMNKSWTEFENAYGTHVARRIAEMCVRVDFDRQIMVDPVPEHPDLVRQPDEIDKLLME